MKKLILLCTLFVSISMFSENKIVQKLNFKHDSISVIISPGINNEKIINDLETVIRLQQGVELVEYCSNHNIFIVTVDRTIYPTNELFYNQIKTVSGVGTLLLKEGNKAEIIPFCEFKQTEKLINPELEKALLDK